MAVPSGGGVFQAVSRGDINLDTGFQHNSRRQDGDIPFDPGPPVCVPCLETIIFSLARSEFTPGRKTTTTRSKKSTSHWSSSTTHIGPPSYEDGAGVTASNAGSTTSSNAGTSAQVTAPSNSSIHNSSENTPSQGPSVVSMTVTEAPIITQVVSQMSSATRDNKGSKGLIAGSVVGVVALLSLSIGVFLYCRRYSRRARWRSSRSDDLFSFTMAPPSPAQIHSVTEMHEHELYGGQGVGWESVVISSEMRTSTSNPPPPYRP